MRSTHTRGAIAIIYQKKHLECALAAADIPLTAADSYELYEMVTLKARLNEAKSRLDHYYEKATTDKNFSKLWARFNSIVDIYRGLRYEIERQSNAKLVTNAWLKYWEIYTQYNLIPATPSHTYRVFFNAELPGAALAAFNHYMKTMRPGVAFDWRASSLAPGAGPGNASDALGDNYGLYEMNKDKWLMTLAADAPSTGTRNDGDVTILANLLDFAARVGPASTFGGVDLYSHDAGIDVSTDAQGAIGFNQQELANAKIHLGCAIAGFLTLRVGGAFVAKQYTFFETFTWNLILIYSQMFESFYICKPLASRPRNSEIYLVGKGFKGFPDAIRVPLVARLENFSTAPWISSDAAKSMLGAQVGEIERFARIVFGQQANIIIENVKLFERYKNNLAELSVGIRDITHTQQAAWLRQYPVGVINDADQIAYRH